MKNFGFGILWVGIAVVFWGCAGKTEFAPRRGISILPQKLHESIALNGEWEFYPSQLIEPGGFAGQKPFFVPVPSIWGNYGESITPNYNCGTFRLRILLNGNHESLGVIIPKIWTASRVYADGELLSTAGQVGCSPQTNHNLIIQRIAALPKPVSDTVELVVQVGNFDFFIGGIVEEFWIGPYAIIEEQWHLGNATSMMWLGCLMLMGFYHLVLYVGQRQNTSLLYFGVISILIGVRFLVFGDHYFYFYLKSHDWLTARLQPQIYYTITFLLAPLGLSYVLSLYPQQYGQRIVRISYLATALTLIPLLVSYTWFFRFIPVFQVLVVATAMYMAFVLLKSAWQRKRESFYQLLGIGVMVFAGINDALHSKGIDLIGENEFIPLAFGFFIFMQVVILAKRFSDAFHEVIDLSENLEQKVRTRTLELQQSRDEIQRKNQALELAYQNITDSLRYAKRIQTALLGQESGVTQNFRDGFVIFEPKEIVSGDFYWYAQCDNCKVLAVADCTGHGVPGAFMTVIGNDALNEIVKTRLITDPAAILAELDKRILESLHQKNSDEQRNEGMDIGIAVIREDYFVFAGAKNQALFIHQGQTQTLKASKFPIGSTQYGSEKEFIAVKVPYVFGDRLYLYSDGFHDQFGGPENRKFMSRRFRELLLSTASLPMQAQKAELLSQLQQWKNGQKQTDDILVVGVEF